MSRIPTAELDRLKREVCLLRLVESSGIEMLRRFDAWQSHDAL